MAVSQELLEQCQKKDRRAQNELYRHCFSYLMPVCMRYSHCKDDAVELLNKGFLKIITNLHQKKSDVPFEPWGHRVMINTIIDNFRRNKKYRETMDLDYDDYSSLEDEYITLNDGETQADAEAIYGIIQQLPPASRKVFNLFAIDGYSHKEIAKMLDVTVSTSKWHVTEARKVLKKKVLKMLQKATAIL